VHSQNAMLDGKPLGRTAEPGGRHKHRHVSVEVDLGTQQITKLTAGDSVAGRVPLALDHKSPAIRQTTDDISTVVVRTTHPPDLRTPVPPAQVGDQFLELGARHRIHLGQGSPTGLHRLVLAPTAVPGAHPPVGTPQPPLRPCHTTEDHTPNDVRPHLRPEHHQHDQQPATAEHDGLRPRPPPATTNRNPPTSNSHLGLPRTLQNGESPQCRASPEERTSAMADSARDRLRVRHTVRPRRWGLGGRPPAAPGLMAQPPAESYGHEDDYYLPVLFETAPLRMP
jgi:hypothetical protein